MKRIAGRRLSFGAFASVVLGAGALTGTICRASNQILGWGYPVSIVVPEAVSHVSTLAAGGNHNFGIRADGSILLWGCNSVGQCTEPAPGTTN